MILISEALTFDILARDQASRVFAKVADKVEDLSDELDELGRKKVEPKVDVDTKRAEEKIDRFAKNLRKKVDTAVKNLPDVEITADSSDADREIAQVKKDLKSLRDKEIGVDIDAAQAEARLRELTARLQRLNSESVDIKVKADTLAAVKALSNVKLDAIKLDVDTKGAEKQVGAFATDVRRRLEAAVKTLPELEITADSSDADRELSRIRSELQRLQNAEIGVDIDAAEADARLRDLKRQLEDLGDSTADVRVQTDTAAAIAALKVVDAEVDNLDGRTARVKVDIDRSLSESVIQVAALGRALGALALPASIVAAAPQVAALGAAAFTAVGAIGLIPAAGGAAAAAIGTLVVGFQNFGDAVTEDGEKAAEALAKLAPAAREAAQAVNGLKPAWEGLRLDVQQQLFQGLGERIQQLGTTYMPVLQDAMSRVADGLNYGATRMALFFEQASTVESVRTMFSNLENTVENLTAQTMAPLASIFTDLGVVGSKVLEELTRGAGDAMAGFAAFISEARQTGELEAWIQGGVDALGDLIAITGNVGSALSSIFSAGEQATGPFLENLRRVTEQMATFLSSARGQDILVSTFRAIDDVISALMPGIRDLGGAILTVIAMLSQSGTFTGFATALSSIASAAAPLLEILGLLASTVLPPLLSVVSALAPVLVPLAAGLAAVRLAAAGAERIRNFGSAVSESRTQVGGLFGPMRQLSGEMRVQAALARTAGESFAGFKGALAAMENSQSGVARSVAGMATSYQAANTAVQAFASRAGDAVRRTADDMGSRLAASASRGVEGILRIPGAVADTARSVAGSARDIGRSLSTGLQRGVIYAQETFRQLPQIADQAMERLRTSLYDGASQASEGFRTAAYDIRRSVMIAGDAAREMGQRVQQGASAAADALRQVPARAAEAGRALGTGLRSGVSTAVGALQQLPAAAQNAGQALSTGLQRGVIYAQESLRQLPAQAANAGRALSDGLRTGAAAASDAMRTMATNVATGARTAAQAVADGMRTIPGHIQNAFSTVGSAVSTGIGHLGRFGGAAAGAARSITSGLMSAGGSLVSFLGGPWGVALAVAGTALTILGSQQADAAAKAREHQAALDAVRGTLDQYSGAVTQATVNEKAKQLQQDGSLDMLNRLKVSTSDYTQATLGNQQALDRVVPKLFELTQAGVESSNAFKGGRTELEQHGITLDMLTRAAMGYAPAQEQINQAIDKVRAISPEAANGLAILADQAQRGGGEAAILAQKLGISVNEVKQMQDATRSASTAAQDFQQGLQGISPALAGIKDGVMPTKELATSLQSLSGSAGTAAQMAGQAAAELGGIDAGARAAAGSMQQSRDAFIAAAQGAGMSADQAAALANQIGLIPAAAETNFRTNATGVAAEMNVLKAQIAAVPAGKDVRVQALTADARAQLESLGFQVEQLGDGTFVVRGNTDDARAKLAALDAAARNPATKPLLADPSDARGKDAEVRGLIQTPATKPMLGDPSDVRGKDAEARGLIQNPATKPLLADPSSVLSADAAAAAAIRTPATKPMVGDPAGILGANSTATGAIQTPATKPMLADPSAILGANSTATGAVQTPATKPMLGDPSDAYAKEAALRGAVGQTATKPIAGNNAPGMGANSALTGAVQQTATKPIGGNNAGGMGANAGLVGAVQAPATKPIGANDSGARGVVSSFVGWVAGLVATVRVVANKIGFSGGGIMPMANGGVVASRQPRMIGLARGDAGDPNTFDGHKLKPMPAGRAKVVGPRTYRVIGDRAQGDELYLPLVKSSRWSQTLLEVGAQRMGRELVPEGMQIVPASSPATLAPMANGGMLSAARAILGRMNARGQMFEDWTWKGAPAYVGQYNDALFNEMKRAGYSYANGKRFLEDYIRRASAPQLKQVVQQPPQVRQVSRTAATASAASTGAQVSATTQAASIVAAIGMQTATLSAKLDAIGARLGVQDAQTVNINNTFPVAEMRQLAEQVARTARQQASLGLFGAPK